MMPCWMNSTPGRRERLPEEPRSAQLADVKGKIAEMVKSLRLKDRHIEIIALRLKELSHRVEKVMAENAELAAGLPVPAPEVEQLLDRMPGSPGRDGRNPGTART